MIATHYLLFTGPVPSTNHTYYIHYLIETSQYSVRCVLYRFYR